MTLSLTPRANDLLRYIEGFLAANNGVGPTRREMADAIGEKSVSGAQRLMDQLEERGAIRRAPGRTRAIEVLRSPTITLPRKVYRIAAVAARSEGKSVEDYVASVLSAWLRH